VSLEVAVQERPVHARDYDPALVFRVPFTDSVSSDEVEKAFTKVDIKVVSTSGENAVIAFKSDTDFEQFRLKAVQMRDLVGERGLPVQSTDYDVFDLIDVAGTTRWSRGDRIGSALADKIGISGEGIRAEEIYCIDLELWHHGAEIQNSLRVLESIISDFQHSRITDKFIGGHLALVRAKVSGEALNVLLDIDRIALIDLPPVPDFSPIPIYQADEGDFEVFGPSNDPAKVCVIDSGVNIGHPLLRHHVLDAREFVTASGSAADQCGHGTAVASVAIFGSLRSLWLERKFYSDVVVLSARVSNSDNKLDDEKLFITQLREVVQFYKSEPFLCRVYNLSFGYGKAALTERNGKQALWAAQLDELCRNMDVLFVISAGNVPRETNNQDVAESVLHTYPQNLFEEGCGLCDPATSSIALTVGAIAGRATPAIPSLGPDDIRRVVAPALHPSPFTRTGLGCYSAIKPDFAWDGGNLLFERPRIRKDDNLSVLVCAHEGRLFRFDVGTSFAAPAVSRIAALTFRSLEKMLGSPPTSNLVRAVMAVSAEQPALGEYFETTAENGRSLGLSYRSVGYGVPNDEVCISSYDRDVVLVYQGEIEVDTFQVFEVPIPSSIHSARGIKRITCSLAFDPRVSMRRKDYISTEFAMNLIRGKSLEEVVAANKTLAGISKEERKLEPGAFGQPYKCDLKPTHDLVSTSTLQKRDFSWRKRIASEYGETYYLVVTAASNWDEPGTKQPFSLAVRIRAESDELYVQIRNRIDQRVRARSTG
jgi:hypothetical protein